MTLELGGKSPHIILEDADLATAMPVALARLRQQRAGLHRRHAHPRARKAGWRSSKRLQGCVETPQGRRPATNPGDRSARWSARSSGSGCSRYIRLGVDEGATLLDRRRRPARRAVARLVRPPDVVHPCRQRHADRARGDLRAGALVSSPIATRPKRSRSPTTPATGCRPTCCRPMWIAQAGGRTDCRPDASSINGAPHEPFAPFGGFKQSGIGREYGTFGLDAFLEPRAVLM